MYFHHCVTIYFGENDLIESQLNIDLQWKRSLGAGDNLDPFMAKQNVNIGN